MTEITLIRHGQANSEARDEASYDRLSELGHRQAAWLGDHLKRTRPVPIRLYTGTLRRHVETATSMDMAPAAERDSRLNEIDYFTLAELMLAQHGLPLPKVREDFAGHMHTLFETWQAGGIHDAPESFAAFEDRAGSVLEDIANGHGPAVVVTSGGVIAMAMRLALGLSIEATAQIALATMNTSVHRLHPIAGRRVPVLFNAVPHLETPDRHFAQTHL